MPMFSTNQDANVIEVVVKERYYIASCVKLLLIGILWCRQPHCRNCRRVMSAKSLLMP